MQHILEICRYQMCISGLEDAISPDNKPSPKVVSILTKGIGCASDFFN